MTFYVDKFVLSKDQHINGNKRGGDPNVQYLTQGGPDETPVQLVVWTLESNDVFELQNSESITIKYGDRGYNVHIKEIAKIEDYHGKYVIVLTGLIQDPNPVKLMGCHSAYKDQYDRLQQQYNKLQNDFVDVCKQRDHIQARLNLALLKPYDYEKPKYW
jgi:hypothetical protein